MGQTQPVYKIGWGTLGFIGENLGRAKGLKKNSVFFFHGFVL
jgi:hypothetical protein